MSVAIVAAPARPKAETMSTRWPAQVKRTVVTAKERNESGLAAPRPPHGETPGSCVGLLLEIGGFQEPPWAGVGQRDESVVRLPPGAPGLPRLPVLVAETVDGTSQNWGSAVTDLLHDSHYDCDGEEVGCALI